MDVRQGCHLRPYLFIDCTEILISLINSSNNISEISQMIISKFLLTLMTDGTETLTDDSIAILKTFSHALGCDFDECRKLLIISTTHFAP